MKRKTYDVLSRIPIVNCVVGLIVDDPNLGSSLMREEGMDKPIVDYMERHPDVHITRQLAKKILKNSKN